MSWRSNYDYVSDFYNGLAIVMKRINYKYKYGYVNTEGKEVVPLIYDYVSDFYNGFAIVKKIIDGKWKLGVVNTKGEEVISCVYDDFEYAKQLLEDYLKKNSLIKFLEE